MSVFSVYAILTSIFTIGDFLALRYFALAYIYFTPERMFSGSCLTAMTTAVGMVVLALLIAYAICRPFDRTLRKIKNENYVPDEEEIRKCLSCYKKLIILTIAATIVGFGFGQGIVTYFGVKAGRHENIPLQITLIILQAVSFGALCAQATISGLDFGLAKFRRLLKVKNIDRFKMERGLNFSTMMFVTCFISIFFIGINMLSLLWGSTRHPEAENVIGTGVQCLITSCAFGLIPFIFLALGLSSRIKITTNMIEGISKDGNLSARLNIAMLDDFGSLISTINTMMERFNLLVKDLKEKALNAVVSAEDISSRAVSANTALDKMTDTLSKIDENSTAQSELVNQADDSILTLVENISTIQHHVNEQQRAVEAISSSVTQMSASINSVTETANLAQKTSDVLSASSEAGKKAVDNAVKTMHEIQKASEEVHVIIKAIEDVSEKTNLLAMNAAIEAAHAGKIGAGFAVVANEVRALAALSSKSAKEIQDHINAMSDKIDEGVKAINNAGEAFKDINDKVDDNAVFVKTIFSAMEEQNLNAKNTKESTESVVVAIKAVGQLTTTETQEAGNVRRVIQSVVNASRSTIDAVNEGIIDTEDLKDSISEVGNSASNNKKYVNNISTQMDEFKV